MSTRPSQRLRSLWAVPKEYTIADELAAARETALLHAQALDETKRDLARAQRLSREVTRAKDDELEILRRRLQHAIRDRQKLALEALALRRANRELQQTLDEVQKLVNE